MGVLYTVGGIVIACAGLATYIAAYELGNRVTPDEGALIAVGGIVIMLFGMYVAVVFGAQS